MESFDGSPNMNSYFEKALTRALHEEIGIPKRPQVESYLVDLMSQFMREESLFPIKDELGHPVKRVSEMLEYGDIRLKAKSFEEERKVHRHIGNLLLFCGGFFPEFLPRLGMPNTNENPGGGWLSPSHRGAESYHLASLFDYDPHSQEANIFKVLSLEFTEYQMGFKLVRQSMTGFGHPTSN